MKKLLDKKSIACVFIACTIGILSCKKSFLDITPKGKLIASNTVDYDHLLNNALINNNSVSGVSADAAVPMGDDAIAADPNYSTAALRTQRLFQWANEIYEQNQVPPEVQAFMNQMYIFNKVINEVKQSQNGTQAQINALYGEAKAQRAYNNFMLVNYFGKPYNAATAATDPGFVLVTTADV